MNESSFFVDLRKNELTKNGVLGCVFSTEKNKYYYDVITSKILKVKDILFYILDSLTKSNEEIRIKTINKLNKKYKKEEIIECLSIISNHKKEEGLFKNITEDFKFILKDKGSEVARYNQIILEVSQKCNFRCSYCAFSGNYKYERNHTNKIMSEELALRAIDFYISNIDRNMKPLITFYGGEPLTNKKLIKKCVAYSKSKYSSIKFTLQTNGYLLDKEFCEYVHQNRFDVSVSIDGPKEIHDRCRKLHSGKGTYDKILSNLKFLYEIDQDYYKKHISISYTYGTRKHFQKLINFHNKHPLMKGLKLNLNYISEIGLNDNINYYDMINNPNYNSFETRDILDKAFWKYIKDMSNNIRFEDILFTRGIVKIIYRKPVDKNEFVLKGPCSIGRKKLFVSTEGGYKVCDKTTRLPLIGNVKDGINWSYIKKMEDDLIDNCKDCKKCWAMSLCDICWVHLYSFGPKIDIDMKRMFCKNYIGNYLESLKRYAQILEYDASILDKLESEYRSNKLY